jgi:hypothetical protein
VSKSVFSTVLTVVGFALLAIPGIGQAIGLPMIAAGISSAAVIGVSLMVAGTLIAGAPKPKALSTSPTDRLTATLDPTTPRKIAWGNTALGCDVRYQAFTGANQEYLEMIICHASHKVAGSDKLYLDNELAWDAATGGVHGRYATYLTVTPILEGTSSNGIAIDGTWTSSCTLTGCAYTHLKAKLTGPDDKTQSPFSGGVTNRMTFIGRGALIYDPRKDSTVAGGSGTHRADDQTTWQWDDNAARNPALEELWYELGWRINGKLAVGKGVPPARLDLASYAVAANACDELVTLKDGTSTEPRYRGDTVVSEGDDPGAVRDNLCATMNAVLRDAGGKLALAVLHNDLATPVTPHGKTAFDEDDVLGDMQWDQTPSLNQTFNIVRGRRTDPSAVALFQPVDFPEVKLASPDGIDRIDTIDLLMVQSNGQAQRLAKQRLQRNQYQGKLTFTGGPNFWGLNIGDPFALKHAAFGWNPKLFRLAGQKIHRTGEVEIVAVEENTDIYAWDKEESDPVVPGAPVIYDPQNDPIIQGIGDGYGRTIDGPPQKLSFDFDYTLAPEPGELPRDLTFKLMSSLGQVASGVAWSYLVTGGKLNGFTASSGPQAMTGSDLGTLTVTSIDASNVSVQVTATLGGRSYVTTVQLTKIIGPAPAVTTIASKTSGFTSVNSTTFVDVSGAITGTLPAGKTSAKVNIALDMTPTLTGSWTDELKLMRDISGTPTQIGTTQGGNSEYIPASGGDPASFSPASFNLSITDTGLTGGTSYTWRIYARETATPKNHNVTGSVTVTA